MGKAFEALIQLYADDRPICNCGQAYYTRCGIGYQNGEFREDMLACAHGCSANLIQAKEYVAERVLAELANKDTL